MTDRIDEISKKTLGSYVGKAVKDIASASSEDGRASAMRHAVKKPFSKEYEDGVKRVVDKRKAGVTRALKTLTKEETELLDLEEGRVKNAAAIKTIGSSKKGGDVAITYGGQRYRLNPNAGGKYPQVDDILDPDKHTKVDANHDPIKEEFALIEEYDTHDQASQAMARHQKKFPNKKLSVIRGKSGKHHVVAHTSGGMSRVEEALFLDLDTDGCGRKPISEVAGPVSPRDIVSVMVHTIGKKFHPTAGDHQFTAKRIKKDKSKLAGDHGDGEDAKKYLEVN